MYEIDIDAFKGPFDLLLFLIKKNRINICDIPIAKITHEYMSYLHLMKEFDIESPSEFLVMASHLIEIKCKMLLPHDEKVKDNGEFVDYRKDLAHQILEYEKFKKASQYLENLKETEDGLLTRSVQEREEEGEEWIELTLFNLISAYKSVLEREGKGSSKPLTIISDKEGEGVKEKTDELRRLFLSKERVLLSTLLKAKERIELVVTFLAVLELVRLNYLKVFQSEPFGDAWLVKV
jgi:segregation and condensation protein A